MGARSSEEVLDFSYRSTQGGRHVISLPPEARIADVQVDGQSVQLRPEKGQLSIGVLPGEHRVHVQWQSASGTALAASTDAVDLHSAASNVRTSLTLAADRWPLFALGRGAGVGPAVLYWGELVALFALASARLPRLSGGMFVSQHTDYEIHCFRVMRAVLSLFVLHPRTFFCPDLKRCRIGKGSARHDYAE